MTHVTWLPRTGGKEPLLVTANYNVKQDLSRLLVRAVLLVGCNARLSACSPAGVGLPSEGERAHAAAAAVRSRAARQGRLRRPGARAARRRRTRRPARCGAPPQPQSSRSFSVLQHTSLCTRRYRACTLNRSPASVAPGRCCARAASNASVPGAVCDWRRHGHGLRPRLQAAHLHAAPPARAGRGAAGRGGGVGRLVHSHSGAAVAERAPPRHRRRRQRRQGTKNPQAANIKRSYRR